MGEEMSRHNVVPPGCFIVSPLPSRAYRSCHACVEIVLNRLLTCGKCGYRTIAGRDELVARLQLVGQLRRDKNPDDAIVLALLSECSPLMTCPGCKTIGLAVSDVDALDDDGDWQTAVLCEVCRQPIDPERMEVLPDTRRCTECQHKGETGTLHDDLEFCPRCGALVELRVSRGGGITRYKRFCTGGCRL